MKKLGKTYKIEYRKSVIKVDIPTLPVKIAVTIKNAIEQRLTVDPIGFGKPLRYSLKGNRRLRVGNYRIVYKVNYNDHIVTISAIKHRKEIYN